MGSKSTAILFGEADRAIILTLQLLSLGCLLLASWLVYRVSALPPDPGLFPWGA